MSYPTTRRYPRTLAEAWPREHANPITHYPSTSGRYMRPLVCIFAAMTIGAVLALGV